MDSFSFTLYRTFVPKPVRTLILKRNLRRKIRNYYCSLPKDELTEELCEVIEHLNNNSISIFPYEFASKYSIKNIKVYRDLTRGMRYVIHDGKKLYFRKGWNDRRIRRYYNDLLREQDPESPHRYLAGNFFPGNGDEVADIGAADGNFALSVVDHASKIYLVEYNPHWIKALEATFEPWKNKVEIIGKYVSDRDNEKETKLDTLISSGRNISFLKIDVDGFEQKVMDGLRESLSGPRQMKIIICTYHKQNDESDLTRLLQGYGFSVTPSPGYMIFYYDKNIRSPWLRRGLIRAEKQEKSA